MRIDVRNPKRQFLFSVEVDPSEPPSAVRPPGSAPGQKSIYLNWEQAIDDEQHLRRCPVCGCRELFARKDFPQVTGFVIVVLAGACAMVLFGMQEVKWGFAVLGALALIDAVIFFFAGRCLVCYRCRSEFRGLRIRRDHPTWQLAVGEKYSVSREETSDEVRT